MGKSSSVKPKDTRIVYGVGCTWWDGIDKVGHVDADGGHDLPCCPECGGLLFELRDEAEWWKMAGEYAERENDKSYVDFIKWLRGRCHRSFQAARNAWLAERGTKK